MTGVGFDMRLDCDFWVVIVRLGCDGQTALWRPAGAKARAQQPHPPRTSMTDSLSM